jgi:hypothetical protein
MPNNTQAFPTKQLRQPGADETKKGLGAGEQPAEMGLAGGAEHNLPAKAGKPGEFAGRFAAGEDPGCLPKTADGKGDARWIKKSVFMAIVYLQGLMPVGDHSIAGRADKSLISLLSRGVVGTGGRGPGRL